MLHILGTANKGIGVCCNPNSTSHYCVDNPGHVECSTDPVGSGEDKKYMNVLTGDLNYQYFAYCPGTSKQRCQIDDKSSDGYNIFASEKKKKIRT